MLHTYVCGDVGVCDARGQDVDPDSKLGIFQRLRHG